MDPVWSKSRRLRFERCRRGYFLHYFAAPAGNLSGAGRDLRLAAELKKLISLDHYLYRLLREVLHREFATGGAIDRVTAELYRRWGIDRQFGRIRFYEEYYGVLSEDEIAGQGAEKLEKIVRALSAGELADLLIECENRQHLPITTPLEFVLGDTTIFLAPVALISIDGSYRMLELGGSRMPEIAALQFFYVHSFRRIPPHAFSSHFYNFNGDTSVFRVEDIDFTATVQAVSRESEEMAEAFAPEIIANNAYMGIPPTTSACSNCVYRKLCAL